MTETTPSDRRFLGRDDVNDIESILRDDERTFGTVSHSVTTRGDAVFTWDYERSKPALVKLYEKAKTSQWNAETDLDWSIEVDQEAVVRANQANMQSAFGEMDLKGTPFESWGEDEWVQLGIEGQNWSLSQFMHGEQGALICTAQIVETVPWIDAKYYAATQVMDEARHVEVFAKYLDTKLSGHYPVNAHLRMLLDDIIADPRWDIVYLGMQIMVEGLALAAFGVMHEIMEEPLPINLGGGVEISIRELVGKVATACGFTGRIDWDPSKPDGQPRRSLDISRARALLGWEPTRDFDAGLAETVRWWRSQSRG